MQDSRRYRLLDELGRGGMGVVWRARDTRLDREVAVKVVHDWVAADPDLRRRFEREAAALARLQHPHVVRLYDVVESRERTLLVMELVEGDSLAQLVSGRTLDWEDARHVAAPIAAALAYAHERGVVHRDLTPANVLVERDSGRVVVSDFGLARLARAGQDVPVSGVLAGTPEYWSPEQAAGTDSGPATDMFALGCLLYRLLTGAVPFAGEDRLAAGLRRIHEDAPTLAATHVPAEARTLVDALLVRDPARRPDAHEAARRLGVPAHLVTGPPVDGAQQREALTMPAATFAVRRPHRARRRGRLRALAVAVAGVSALGAGGVYAVASMDPPGVPAPAVVGDPLDDARAELAAAAEEASVEMPGVQVTGRTYSEDVPEGAVLAQDPGPGEDVPATGALRVRVSLGSAWASVPDTVGEPTRDALRELSESGFRPVRRYGPSLTVPAWHVAETSPAPGSRLRRPASVTVLVSTGPPLGAIPDVVGAELDDALDALEDSGFAGAVEEVPSLSEDEGTVLELRPAAGARARVGSTVTVVVAREPHWETVESYDGEDDESFDALNVPAGARVVLYADNTSFFGAFDGSVEVSWYGDDEGSGELEAGREAVLVEPSDTDRTLAFRLEPHGSVRWELRIEAVE